MDLSLQKQLLFSMLRIRRIEEAIAGKYSEGEMRCPVHMCIGQEATPVGVCAALESTDAIFSTHRSHGHYLAKSGSLNQMLAEIYGKATGCSHGKGGSMHLVDLGKGFWGSTSIVAGTIPVAVGAAFGWLRQGDSRVVVSFFGDAATEEGLFHESVNFAVLHKLPVIFVCENNLYSVYTHLRDRQPEREIHNQVRGYGLVSEQIDGNDVTAVYCATSAAVTRARRGLGPTFLECKTYRWLEHCGPNYDNDIGYRTQAEYEEWAEKCPIRRQKEALVTSGAISASLLAEWETTINQEIAAAFQFACDSPFPASEELFDHIYAKKQEEA